MSLKTWKAEFYPVPACDVAEADALAHSLRKWEGLTAENIERHGLRIARHYLEEREPEGQGLSISALSCALCYWHLETRRCQSCPLSQELGKNCDDGRDSPYQVFRIKSDPQPMIDALRQCEAAINKATKGAKA